MPLALACHSVGTVVPQAWHSSASIVAQIVLFRDIQ